ncbi:hypothetical protein [Terriglobus sp.]|uniref:hypothetical protein n=1 Tax=Terriglobus sp. TaxID=1889013 RepID=UPI003AFFDF95
MAETPDTIQEPKLEEIATSQDSVYDAVMKGMVESMADLVERVADTGASSLEREIEFAGQTWTVSVRLKT